MTTKKVAKAKGNTGRKSRSTARKSSTSARKARAARARRAPAVGEARTRYFIAGDVNNGFQGAAAYVRFIGERGRIVRWDGSENRANWTLVDALRFCGTGTVREVTAKEARAERRRLEKIAKESPAERIADAGPPPIREMVSRSRLPAYWLFRALGWITRGSLGAQVRLLCWATRGRRNEVTAMASVKK